MGDVGLTGYALTFSDEFDKLSVSRRSPKRSTWYACPPHGTAGNYSASSWDVDALSTSNGILLDRAYLGPNASAANDSWNSGNLSSVDPTGAGFS